MPQGVDHKKKAGKEEKEGGGKRGNGRRGGEGGLIPGLGRAPGEGDGNLLQFS